VSDHGEQKARVAPLAIMPVQVHVRASDPLAALQELLAGAADHAVIVVTQVLPGLTDNSITLHASDLRPLVAEEIDRVAAAAADAWDEAKLEAAETRIFELESYCDDLGNALSPFGEAGRRFHATGDGTLADTYRDVTPEQLRDAWRLCERSRMP
jgi:hypothetical protein